MQTLEVVLVSSRLLLVLPWCYLSQQSPTFLAPGTGFTEGNFSTDWGWGEGLGRIRAHYIQVQLLLCGWVPNWYWPGLVLVCGREVGDPWFNLPKASTYILSAGVKGCWWRCVLRMQCPFHQHSFGAEWLFCHLPPVTTCHRFKFWENLLSSILSKWIQIWDTFLSPILEKKGLQMVLSSDLLGGFLPVSWFASSKLMGFADSEIILHFLALQLATSK